ncbi:MAG TPA: DUF4105 domain-containing protein [Polyangia bacterium]|nr:DUF4105 domain-containing protein [Polyangia bacterium]
MSSGGRCASLSLLAAVFAAAGAGRARAQPAAPPAPLRVSVLTFGPGDHPFFKFGHDAIWIHDPAEGSDRVYNFGTFSFDSPRLIFDFLHGRMTYWLSVAGLPRTLASYEAENRSIQVQELRLDPPVAQALKERLDVNAQPQNRAYKYDYFADNCSTRVRDAIDWATGGRLRAVGHVPARLTLRDQALRMTASYLPLYLAIDLVLGPSTDRSIDRWGEMFIPEELARSLADVRVPDPLADPGSTEALPLVASDQVLFHARRPDPPRVAPRWRGWFLAVGLAVGGLFWLLGWCVTAPDLRRRGRIAARLALGLLISLWGALLGFVGTFLVYVWVATDHVVAHRNQNLFLCPPWALVLVVAGFGIAFGARWAASLARVLALAALAAATAAVLLKLGFGQHQDNGRWIAFFVPAWLGLTAAVSRLPRR